MTGTPAPQQVAFLGKVDENLRVQIGVVPYPTCDESARRGTQFRWVARCRRL